VCARRPSRRARDAQRADALARTCAGHLFRKIKGTKINQRLIRLAPRLEALQWLDVSDPRKERVNGTILLVDLCDVVGGGPTAPPRCLPAG
jgi:hypothetical protein